MHNNRIQVFRNGQFYHIDGRSVKDSIDSGRLLPTDQIYIDGQWYWVKDVLVGHDSTPVNWGKLACGIVIGSVVAFTFISIFSQPKKRRKRARVNTEPVPEWKKQEVRERDGYKCVYCRTKVSRGHISVN